MAALVVLSTACAAGEPDDQIADRAPVEPSTAEGSERSSGVVDDEQSSSTTTTAGSAPNEDGPAPRPGNCNDRLTGVQTISSSAGGPTVDVRLLVPDGLGSEPVPAVLNWHGLGSDGAQQALVSGYETLAETEGFIAVHPTGAASAGNGANSWELAQFDVPGRDDLALVDDLIDRLVAEHCVDPARIYSTGLSNGGFFTALLVCERADRIAAAVSVAGISHPEGCQPSRPVPLIAFHGTADEVVPFAGGRSSLQGEAADDLSGDFFEQSMPDELAQFAESFGCRPDPESTTIGTEITRYDYLGCPGDVPVSFYEIADGGHTWPGSPLGPFLTEVLGRTTDEISATVDGWAFMSQFRLPSD